MKTVMAVFGMGPEAVRMRPDKKRRKHFVLLYDTDHILL